MRCHAVVQLLIWRQRSCQSCLEYSIVLLIVWSRLSSANRNCNFFIKSWEIEIAIFSLWGRFFYDFYEQRLNCIFIVRAIRIAHDYFIIVTHTLQLSAKTLSSALVIRDRYYLPPLSQVRFLFTNELSASGIVVLCSCQKFMNVSAKKLTLKPRSQFFPKLNRNRSKLKKQNHDHTIC